MLQKWVQYHLIHDPTELRLSWDPSDPEDFRFLQKYAENDGSIAYLPSNLVKKPCKSLGIHESTHEAR